MTEPIEDPHAGTASWLFRGAHGGAGTATLVRYSRRHGHTYAALFDATAPADTPVVLVCRDTVSGLRKAQAHAAAAPGGAWLLGLVTVGESPGRPPRAVTGTLRLLSGAMPRLWRVPYIPILRLVPPADDTDSAWPAIHPDLAQVLDEIRVAVAARNNNLYMEKGR